MSFYLDRGYINCAQCYFCYSMAAVKKLSRLKRAVTAKATKMYTQFGFIGFRQTNESLFYYKGYMPFLVNCAVSMLK